MKKIYKQVSRRDELGHVREAVGLTSEEPITIETLKDLLLAGGLTKRMNRTFGTLIQEEGLWDEALELARYDDPRVAFRASWALEWAYMIQPEEIERRFQFFLRDFLTFHNESVQRVYSKMLCDMTRRGSIVLSGDQAAALAEKSFDLLTDPDRAVAVRVWQIELLFDLMPRFGWVEENLTAVVRGLSEHPDCTPAIAAHTRSYFRRISKACAEKA